MSKKFEVTSGALDLLLALIADSGNWSNNPMLGGNVDITPANKGHLTHLKKNGLVSTVRDDRCDFIKFGFSTYDTVTDGVRTFWLGNYEYYSKASDKPLLAPAAAI